MSTIARLLLQRVSRLGDKERRAFIQTMTPQQSYPANCNLANSGGPLPDVHIILSGFACRYVNLHSGERQILGYLVPGDLCDVRGCFAQKSEILVQSLSEVQVTTIPGRDLLDLTQRYPQVMRELWRLIAVEDAITRQWQLNVGRRSSTQRLAHLLSECFARLRAAGIGDRDSCPIPITQTDIADALALTPVHVNRTLTELRRAGLIGLKGHRLTIFNQWALHAVAGFEPGYLQIEAHSPETASAVAAEAAPAWSPLSA